jgi:hypothetical protein
MELEMNDMSNSGNYTQICEPGGSGISHQIDHNSGGYGGISGAIYFLASMGLSSWS